MNHPRTSVCTAANAANKKPPKWAAWGGQHVVLSRPITRDAEAEDELLRVGFAGAEDAARVAHAMEVRLVRRIGEEAGLEAVALGGRRRAWPSGLGRCR
jgi:hypothetical protein